MPSQHAPKYEGPNAALFDGSYDSIIGVVNEFKASVNDGFQVRDLATWHHLIVDAYDVAKTIFNNDFDKEDLTDLVQYIYWAIDPDWPWIPDIVEDPIEKLFIVDVAIPWAVGAAWEAVAGYVRSRG